MNNITIDDLPTVAQESSQADNPMSTLPQVLKSRIAFRCEDWFYEAVRIAAAKRRSSIQQVCTEAITTQLGLTQPGKVKRNPKSNSEAGRG